MRTLEKTKMKNSKNTLKIRSSIVKFTLLFFIGFTNISFAQDFDLIKLHTAYYPTQSINESSENGEFGFIEWGAILTLPQVLKNQKKTVLLHTLGYTNLRVNSDGSFNNVSVEGKRYFHDISYNLGIIKPFNQKWVWILNIKPTLASDFEEGLRKNDFLFQANTMVVNKKREKITYGFGLAYNTRLGRQLLLPLGMFSYSTSKMKLDILLPNKISLLFNTTNETFYYGFEIRLNGGFYNNTSSVETVNTAVDEVGYSRLNVGPAFAVRLKNSIKITLAGGVSGGRRLEFIAVDEEVIDRTPELGPFLRMGVSFTPSKEEKS